MEGCYHESVLFGCRFFHFHGTAAYYVAGCDDNGHVYCHLLLLVRVVVAGDAQVPIVLFGAGSVIC